MDIVGDRKFVEIPGTATLELPPLLVKDDAELRHIDRVMEMAARIIEKEDLVPSIPVDFVIPEEEVSRRKMDMALNMVGLYKDLRRHWYWGDGIVEWIRQCEITFDGKPNFKALLRPDVWPHAGRSSFVTLLEDKEVPTGGIDIEKAVGLRLTFRHLPPLIDFSDQFLFYLNTKLAGAAYQTWANMIPPPVCALPPERFDLHVYTM
jgi:hypothetical protein